MDAAAQPELRGGQSTDPGVILGSFLRNPWWAVVLLAFSSGISVSAWRGEIRSLHTADSVQMGHQRTTDSVLGTMNTKLDQVVVRQGQILCALASRAACLGLGR